MKVSLPDPDLVALMKDIFDTLGFNAEHYEIKHFKRRIQSRMRATKSSDYREYLKRLKNDPDEREKLKCFLTVNVTEFFRNPEVYKTFQQKTFPEHLKKGSIGKSTIRIWSLGCATGPEPYSIAMTIAEVMGKNSHEPKIKIFATDIDRDALNVAIKGEYTDVTTIPPSFVKKYMIKLPDGKLKFKKEISDLVTFKRHDVFSDRPLRNIDILFCRNTIIYFNKESKKDLYRLFNNSLIMGGNLILGKAESFIAFRAYGFEVQEKKSHIFKKTKNIPDNSEVS